ncbi:MAG: divergent polysaccharide deacetylase family protein [Alphaproteobacteria bacterium]
MIKKTLAVLFALVLSYSLLEGISYLHDSNTESECQSQEVFQENKDVCAYIHKPYKNIVFDFVSKHLTTDVDINDVKAEYAIIDDIQIPTQEEVDVKEIKKEDIHPKIAIVIDDMGISNKGTLNILSLDAPLTLSFLTYSKKLQEYINMAKDKSFEVMVHVPMEAKTKFNEAPDLLRVSDSNEKIAKNLNKMLDKFKDVKAINNHTGSLFTENEEKMNVVMTELKKRNMMFLDSKTSPKSVGEKVAKKHGVKYLSRNVFLDNENKFEYIMGQIKQTEKIAKKYGFAIAICHPKTQTYEALKHWIATQTEFEVVNLKDI